MEVVLLSDVDKLGLRGDVVDVARGYARNFLLPRKLAEPATPRLLAELRKREAQRARHEARSVEHAQEIAELLRTTALQLEMKAGPTGALFGSVTPTDIADELWRARKVRVDRRKIGLSEPLKRVGRYEVPVEIFENVEAEVTVLVIPEGGQLPPAELEPPAAEGEDAAAAGPDAGPRAAEQQVREDTVERALDTDGPPSS